MEKAYLDCLLREETGKNKIGALRDQGFIPAIVYGQGHKPLAIKLNRSELVKFMHIHHGAENIVITLRFAGDAKSKAGQEEKPVLIKEIQLHPVKDTILHIDFNQISLTKKISVKVPIRSKGDSFGVKQEGGVLNQILWELDVKCLPTNIPEKIEFDITAMKIGDSAHVKDLVVPEGIEVTNDVESIVFAVVHPKKLEEVVPGAEGEAGAATEPEVTKEKKEEAEGAAGAKKEEEGKKEAPKDKK